MIGLPVMRVSLSCWASGLGLALLLLSGVSAKADEKAKEGETRKPAWQWAVAERLSQRFDPDAMEARAAQRFAEDQASLKKYHKEEVTTSEERGLPVDRVDGDKTPELFLPYELFDHLLDMGFPREGGHQLESRRAVEERAVVLGFGRDLWTRLESVAGSFLKLRKEADEQQRVKARFPGSRVVDSFGMDSEGIKLCRARAKAIAAAKAEFGEEPLLRLLYIGATDGYSRTYHVKTESMEDHHRFLIDLEGGCR